MPAHFSSGFMVRQPAWHGLGTVVDTPPETWEEARKLAGLDWEPIRLPVRGRDTVPSGVDENGEPVYGWDRDITGWSEIVRSDKPDHTLYIGPMTYELITHADMGLIMDAIMGDTKRHWETGGSLKGGRQVWCLVELGDPIEIKGDPSATRRYVAILNAHDGSLACQAVTTMTRIVCANTFDAARYDGKESGFRYKFMHTSGWRDKLHAIVEEAREALLTSDKQVAAYRKFAEVMTSKPVTRDQAMAFCDELIFPRKDEMRLGKIAFRNVQEHRNTVRSLLAGPTCEGIADTAYGLIQAGAEWAEHYREYENRETLFGRSVITEDQYRKRGRQLAMAAADGRL